jgi:RND family efflux transporter MFP subunit
MDVRNAFILTREEISKTLSLPAELQPYERAEINTKLDAYVQRVLVDIGDKVNRGQVLAVLEAPEINSRFAEAQAKLLEAEARYKTSEDRAKRLEKAAQNPGVVADADLIAVQKNFEADSASWQAAGLMARSISQQRDYLIIRAPFEGIITKRNVDAGDFVNQNRNESLFVLERPDILRLKVHIPEAYVNAQPQSDTMSFTTDGLVNRSFKALLARKSGSIDPDTRTELWEYEFENQEGYLKPGMYATVNLQLKRSEASFVVPQAAVVTSMEKKFIIRVENKKVERVDVRTGFAKDGYVEIFGALTEGDTMLSRASDELKLGEKIEIQIE